MGSIEKPKYRVVTGFPQAFNFEQSINALAEAGYGVAQFAVGVDGKLSAILKLKEDPTASFKDRLTMIPKPEA